MADLGAGATDRLTFEISEDELGNPMVTLGGDLDISTARKLDLAVARLLESSPDRLVVDLRELQFADSSGIALLVRWANLVPQVEIREPSPLLRRIIERMGLSKRLHLRP
jgi:anti-sigma B factor antagonist